MVTRDEIILCLDKAQAIDEASGLSLDEIKNTVSDADATETEALTDKYFLVKKSSGKNPVFWLAKTGLKRAELLKEQLEAEYNESVKAGASEDQTDTIKRLESELKETKKQLKQYRDGYEKLQGEITRSTSELKMAMPEYEALDLVRLAYEARVKLLTTNPLAQQIKFEFEHYGYKLDNSLPVIDQISRFLTGYNQLKAENKTQVEAVKSVSGLLDEIETCLDHFNVVTEKDGVKLAMVDRIATTLKDYKEWREKSTEINLMAVKAHGYLDKEEIAIGLTLDERVKYLVEILDSAKEAVEPDWQPDESTFVIHNLRDHSSLVIEASRDEAVQTATEQAQSLAVPISLYQAKLIGKAEIRHVADWKEAA